MILVKGKDGEGTKSWGGEPSQAGLVVWDNFGV